MKNNRNNIGNTKTTAVDKKNNFNVNNCKSYILIACTLMMLVLLSGCQLAKEDGLTFESERLIGVFITNEYLDLFDFDTYLQDNISDFVNGSNVEIKPNIRYGGRLYAQLQERSSASDDSGETHSIWEYIFPDVEGIAFYSAEITEPDGTSYFAHNNGGAICDGHIAYGADTSLEGTLYLSVTDKANTVYVNPVYQSNDGQVFAVAGDGYTSSTYNAEGTVFSTTIEETYSTNNNGEMTNESIKVTVNIAAKYPPESIGIIQMDAKSNFIARDDYPSIHLPEQLVVNSKTAYLVVETTAKSPDGQPVITRQMLEADDYYITGYIARPDGIIEPQSVEILWE